MAINTPMPAVDSLLRSPAFRDQAPPAPMPDASSGRSLGTPPDVARMLGAILQQGAVRPAMAPPASSGTATVGQSMTQMMTPATPASLTLDRVITRALEDPENGRKGVYLSAADLDTLGADVHTLEAVLSRRGLRAATNFDGWGGVLVARDAAVLNEAERQRSRGASVPVIIAMQGSTP